MTTSAITALRIKLHSPHLFISFIFKAETFHTTIIFQQCSTVRKESLKLPLHIVTEVQETRSAD